MIVVVHVKTGARQDSVRFDEESGVYLVSVKARPIEGEANVAITKLISETLGVPKSQIVLKSGQKSKTKRFEVLDFF